MKRRISSAQSFKQQFLRQAARAPELWVSSLQRTNPLLCLCAGKVRGGDLPSRTAQSPESSSPYGWHAKERRSAAMLRELKTSFRVQRLHSVCGEAGRKKSGELTSLDRVARRKWALFPLARAPVEKHTHDLEHPTRLSRPSARALAEPVPFMQTFLTICLPALSHRLSLGICDYCSHPLKIDTPKGGQAELS